jgi:hypothetical protein
MMPAMTRALRMSIGKLKARKAIDWGSTIEFLDLLYSEFNVEYT